MRRITLVFYWSFMCLFLYAQTPATVTEAEIAATRYAHLYLHYPSLRSYNIVSTDSLEISCHTVLREISFDNGVSIVLSGYKDCQPVLFYSFNQERILPNISSLPDGLYDFVYNYAYAIQYVADSLRSAYIHPDWMALLDSDMGHFPRSGDIYGPLLTTKWGQSLASKAWDFHAFNFFIEENEVCSHGYCPTGCVATAMAQIMNYWKYPVYLPNKTYQFDWCNMADSLTSHDNSIPTCPVNANYENERNAIARLMADCGRAADMDYCHNKKCQSFTTPLKARNSLVDTFNYSPDAIRRLRSTYPNDSDWKSFIVDDIMAGKPVLYAGISYNTNEFNENGHAFVCDGYNEETGLFHFNWGHEYDDLEIWCSINSIIQGNYNWNHLERAVFNIHPAYTQDYCDFSLPLWMHYYNYYTLLGNTTPDPHLNVPKTFTTLASVPQDNAYPSSWRTISSGDTSEYVAHKEVVLQPGFTAEAGSTFVARIEPCADCEEGDGLRRQPSHKQDIKDENLVETRHGASLQDGTDGSLLVYPNPTDGMLYVALSNADETIDHIVIANLAGREVAAFAGPDGKMDVTKLPAGVYLLTVTTASGDTLASKFVKTEGK